MSSKQKKLLFKYVVKNKISVEKAILNEENELFAYLARQINCTPKRIINYMKEWNEKKSKEKINDQQTGLAFKSDEIDELRKRDVFYYKNPPNAYPFGRKSSKEKSSNANFNQLNVLGDLTNSLIN